MTFVTLSGETYSSGSETLQGTENSGDVSVSISGNKFTLASHIDRPGSQGEDIYIGGDGNDFLIADQGAEQFLFSRTQDDVEELDILNGFDPANDSLVIAGFDIGDGAGQISAADFLEQNAYIKKANLFIELGENHTLKIKNVVKGDFADAEPRDFAALIEGESDVPGDILLADDPLLDMEGVLVGDWLGADILDLGDGFFLPLIPVEEAPAPEEDLVLEVI